MKIALVHFLSLSFSSPLHFSSLLLKQNILSFSINTNPPIFVLFFFFSVFSVFVSVVCRKLVGF